MKLWTGLTITLLGLVGAQVDYESFDTSFLSEVNDVLSQVESGEISLAAPSGIQARARSGVPDPILAQFAGRQLPPGIKLQDFVGPNGFQTQQFLRALQAALRKQAEENRKRQQALRQKQAREKAEKDARDKAAREAAKAKAEAAAAAKKAAEEAEARKAAEAAAAKAAAEASCCRSKSKRSCSKRSS